MKERTNAKISKQRKGGGGGTKKRETKRNENKKEEQGKQKWRTGKFALQSFQWLNVDRQVLSNSVGCHSVESAHISGGHRK